MNPLRTLFDAANVVDVEGTGPRHKPLPGADGVINVYIIGLRAFFTNLIECYLFELTNIR